MPVQRPVPPPRNGEQIDGSVTIDLNAPDPVPPTTAEPAAPAQPKLFERRDRVPLDPAPDQMPPPPSDEGPDLEQQLLDMKKREQAASQRAAEERDARLRTEQQAREHINRTTQGKAESDYYMVSNALAAKTTELEQAKNQRMAALSQGDHNTAEEWNERMLDLKLDIRSLTEGKTQMERDLQGQRQQRQQPPPQQPQIPRNIEEAIAGMPALMEVEKNWLRKHPDAVFQPRQFARLQAAYMDWEDTGEKRGTPQYFRFFNDRMGYDNNDPEYDDVEGLMPANDNRQRQMEEPQRLHNPPARYSGGQMSAAPVSRVSPGTINRQAANDNSVTLSPQQREAARFSSISEKEYARNLQRLRDLKRRGYYQEVG